MRIGSRRPGRRGAGILSKALMLVAVALVVVVFIDFQIRPVVENMVAYQAKVAAFRTINDAMMQELSLDEVAYDDIVRLSRADDGTVSSIQTDVVAVNRLKSRMADTVAAQLAELERQSLMVPVGTLLGNNFTSGRGPEIEIRLIPVGYVQSELYNQFTSAGINQTLHQIMLKTTVQMVAVMPGYSVKTETATSFCIAETVIVGAIPDGYTVVGEDGRSTISKVNDYGAGAGRAD